MKRIKRKRGEKTKWRAECVKDKKMEKKWRKRWERIKVIKNREKYAYEQVNLNSSR